MNLECTLENKEVTSDGSNNDEPSKSTNSADIITYTVPLVLVILVLILVNAHGNKSNVFEKKENAEKPLSDEDKNESSAATFLENKLRNS